jgi:hypothetical protein
MLKGLNTSGRYLEVVGGTASTHVSRTYNSSAHNQGQMMYDLDNQCMKVFDGNSWIVLAGSYATVNLSYEAQSLLDWAQHKREQERLRDKLIQEHPQLKEAYDDLKNEQEKFDLLVTLAKKFNNEQSVKASS